MCALAQILKQNGYNISGSDIRVDGLDDLKKQGIKVFCGHNRANIDPNCDLVVYSSSIATDNPELLAAQQLGIKTICRGCLLGEICKNYQNVISVSGSHGKTTTSAMIFEILIEAGLEPTMHIGGILRSTNSNYYIGDNQFFVTEACEFKDNFLYLESDVAVVTNIEPEHMDYFKTVRRLKQSFQKFADKAECLVAQAKLKHNNKIIVGAKGYHAKNLRLCDDGRYKFDCFCGKKFLYSTKLGVIGKFNVDNAIFATAVAKHYGVSNKVIKTALKNFAGVNRRYDIIAKNPTIIHDYAHHPSEIKAVIQSTKSWTLGRLIVVFQPHTYSRTLSLMQEFAQSFACCDKIIILKTYSAREDEIVGGRAIDLYHTLQKSYCGKVAYYETFTEYQKLLQTELSAQDCVLFLGAGNIVDLAKEFAKSTGRTE